VLFIFVSASAPPLRNGSRTFPFGFHSRLAAALRLSSDSEAIARCVSLKSTERSTTVHAAFGVGEGGAGAPCSAHGSGEGGTETAVAKNSQVPLTEAPDSKCERGREKPFPLSPGAKIPAGAANPEGERTRFRRNRDRGTLRAVPPIFEYGNQRCGTLPTITEQISGLGMMSRVASMMTAWSRKPAAVPVIGVKATAGKSVSIVTKVLLGSAAEAYPFWFVLTLRAPILRGRDGTGVNSIRTWTLTDETEGVGDGVPCGVEVGVGEEVGPIGELSGGGVKVDPPFGVGVGGEVVSGVGVRVLVGVGEGDGATWYGS